MAKDKLMKDEEYEQIYDGQEFKFGDAKSNRRDVIACCDCGLVHEFKVRLKKNKKGKPELYMVVNRMPEHTSYLRRTTPQKKK